MVTLQAALAAMLLSGTSQTALLDFYTNSCPACRAMEPTIQELERTGYPVQRINAEQQPALAAQFHVRCYPTYVMVVDGKEVGRKIEGGTSLSALQRLCKLGDPAATPGKSPVMLAQNDPPNSPAAPPARPAPSSPFDEPGRRPAAIQAVSVPAKGLGGVPESALIAATVRLRVKDANGTSCGSGTIIDTSGGKALILTCGHIFRDSQGKGPITVDLFGPTPQQVSGGLYSYDLDRDVGLVVITTPGPVATARVAPPGYRIEPGTEVISIGCDNGGAPTVRHSRVTSLNGIQAPPTIQIAGQSVEGRSGGGLFSTDGYVLGVCYAADPSYNEALFAAPASIYAELDRQKLSDVYKSTGGAPGGVSEASPAAALARNAPPTMPSRMPGMPEAAALATLPANGVQAATGLLPHEQAAMDEINRRVQEGAEVLCIIRSRENPSAKSEVIMLDHASPKFIQQLSANARIQDKPYQTSLELPNPRKKLLEWSAPEQRQQQANSSNRAIPAPAPQGR
jgi:thiol-disulfide isomerase/thioredoxin